MYSIKRGPYLLLLLLLVTLIVSGCTGSIEDQIAKRYPSAGQLFDRYSYETEKYDFVADDYVERVKSDTYKGRLFISEKSVPETAKEISEMKRPTVISPASNEKMALRYDSGLSKRVVVLYGRSAASDQMDVPSQAQTLIEVLEPRHAYYRHYHFMTGLWGWGSPFFGSYGRRFADVYDPEHTAPVPTGTTVRRGSIGSSTKRFFGGGPGFGK